MLKTIQPQRHRGLWVGRDTYCGPDDLYMIWYSPEGFEKAMELIGAIGIDSEKLLNLQKSYPLNPSADPRNHSVGKFFGPWLTSISGSPKEGDVSLIYSSRRAAA